MRHAKGFLYYTNHAVSEVIVTNVGETESSIQIIDQKAIDATKQGLVILSAPAACGRQLPARP
jgi:hypothetical protein